MMSDWPRGMAVAPIGEWPGQLTRHRKLSTFRAYWADTLSLLDRELTHLHAKNAELLVAIDPAEFRLDGYPRASARQQHPGVILSFDTPELGHLSFPCDTFTSWQDNTRAVALTMEKLRAIDRYGVTKRGEQFRGFLAIEAGGIALAGTPFTHEPDSVRRWLLDLLDRSDPGFVPSGVRSMVRAAQRATHPDTGGDAETFRLVQLAESYLREAGEL